MKMIELTWEWIIDGETQYGLGQTTHPLHGDDLSMGEIFRNLRSWHGRCDSSVYVDTDHGVKRVGWHFIKRADDGNGCIGTWATVFEREDSRVYV